MVHRLYGSVDTDTSSLTAKSSQSTPSTETRHKSRNTSYQPYATVYLRLYDG